MGVMQTFHIASVEGAHAEQSPAKLTSSSRLINIGSVRATSLRASGLRAASSKRRTDAQNEKQAMDALETEPRMSFNQLSCLSSSVSVTSSTHLSYTHSQDPGEDSQLNALAMVDKLVNLNTSLMWQKPELSTVANQSCMQGPQNNMGIQSLARNVDMKNLQGKMGIYDWIDSQPGENGDLEQVSPMFEGQLEATKKRKVQERMAADLACGNDNSLALIMDEEASSMKQQNTGCQPLSAGTAEWNHTKESTSYLEDRPTSESMKNLAVSNELHDTDASYGNGEADRMDIGANTQIALEAMDIMRCGNQLNHGSAPYNEKAMSALCDIGNDTQTAIDAMDIMLNNENAAHNEEAMSSLFDIGDDTQTAADAIDIMRHGIETDRMLSKGVRQEEIEQGLRVWNSWRDVEKHASGGDLNAKKNLSPVPRTLGRKGGLPSKAPTVLNSISSFKEVSKTLKNHRSALINPPAGLVDNSNKRFLLDFSSAMVPRRKRSRLCAPRGTLVENMGFSGCREVEFHLHKPLMKADKQAKSRKPTGFRLRKSPKAHKNSPEVAVLTESTNGESIRRTKKESLTKPECYALLEQSRKRRKCESGSIFVLFSHSLSEATIKQQKKMLIKLGGHVVTLAAKATHFVADSFVRSRNMLEIMGAGKMVVTTMWLEGCSQAEYFVDENSYILQDIQKEKQWGFSMHSSLATSRRKPLFKGMKVVVSTTTAPDFEALKAVIECAGGQALQKLSSSSHSKADDIASISFVIGSEDDYDFCVEFLKKGCKVYSTELILHGVVTQNLDFSRNRLFEDYVP